MAYTPDATDTAQPTGNQALSTAALEFRTLKTYIQATKTAQAAATALVQTNLNTAVSAQDTRDDGQDSAITAAAALGTTGIANAAAALAVAQGKLTAVVLSGSGTWTVPDGVTQLVVLIRGGGTADVEYSADAWGGRNWYYYSDSVLGQEVAELMFTAPGNTIAYACGTEQLVERAPATGSVYTPCYIQEVTPAGESFFGVIKAKPAILRSACGTIPDYPYAVPTRDAAFYGTSLQRDGHLVPTQISNAAYTPNVTNQTAGIPGTIVILY